MASNSTEVYIKLPTGRSSRYDTYPSQSIGELCEKIAGEENVRTNQVNLKYQGKILDPSKTIRQYGVRVETILKAEILVPQMLDIVICRENGEPADELVISNLEPVSKLFQEIATKMSENISKLQIKIEGRVLQNSATKLVDAGIARGSSVVVSKLPDKVESRPSEGAKAQAAELDEATRQNVLSSFNARGKHVEVAFSFDTTGSMYSYLTEVRRKLRECCTRLIQDIPNIRISIIAQGDYCDSESLYAVRVLDLTSDVQSLVDFANNVPSTSGGDSPECYELVLKKAQQLDWSEESAKALVMIGDLYPHPPSYTDQHISWRDELDVLTGIGVRVYGVQAGQSSAGGLFYRELAEVSGGCYLNLSHMDVITDMFLAVCYNEGEDDMLENFEQELVQAGNMTDRKQEMFRQLKEKPETKKSASNTNTSNSSQRNLQEPWWDVTLDTTQTPQFVYNADRDIWLPFRAQSSPIRSVITTPRELRRPDSTRRKKEKSSVECSVRPDSTRSRSKAKVGCSVM
ncbi:von Willebrand factor type a [Plakobranchus ocellatus]|uniref:von Willebrand factor type a n=1 Tax=Plakobranchus ocellatus TaxID=259542 RepID=A0AAV4B2X0_9GAST|nr:von Willebrand factor type a [Plakobranchus ocellatus]